MNSNSKLPKANEDHASAGWAASLKWLRMEIFLSLILLFTTPVYAKSPPAKKKGLKSYYHADGSLRLPAKVVEVVAGDQLTVDIKGLRREPIKLIFVESGGEEGKKIAEELLLNQEVDISFDGLLRNNEGMLQAVVWYGGGRNRSFQEELIVQGLSIYSTRKGRSSDLLLEKKLQSASEEAKEKMLGVWSGVRDPKVLLEMQGKMQTRKRKDIKEFKIQEFQDSNYVLDELENKYYHREHKDIVDEGWRTLRVNMDAEVFERAKKEGRLHSSVLLKDLK